MEASTSTHMGFRPALAPREAVRSIPRVPRLWAGPLARADGIHRFPAKMALGLGDVFVNRVLIDIAGSSRLVGERFHDPMCGSGTTLLVARSADLRVTGSDILPTSTVIASAKLNRLNSHDRQALVKFSKTDHLSRQEGLLWSWPSAREWFTARALRALQDIRLAAESQNGCRWFPHLLTAISWASWDVSSADSNIMVPTHSRRSPFNRRVEPDTVQYWFRHRLQRIVAAQEALADLGIGTGHVDIWEGDALDRSSWPRDARFVLTSPPYGIGIDYVRASSLQWRVLFPESEPNDVRSRVLGRPRIGNSNEDALPPRHQSDRWWKAMRTHHPQRARAFLSFVDDLTSFLTTAEDQIPSDGAMGLVMGNPQTCGRWTIPLVEMTAEIAQEIGFREGYPRISSSLRRRFQSGNRRSSSSPIKVETLLTLVPS
jgi:hypothetical protein